MIRALFRPIKYTLFAVLFFGLGIAFGGYLFIHTQPRTFLQVTNCETKCFKSNELAGLLASAGIQQLPNFVPNMFVETDKTVVIENPVPQAPIHYVILPKKDIKNPADITEEDKEYLADAYATIAKIVKDKNLSKYKILTNGPGYQQITYLHFHLIAPKQ